MSSDFPSELDPPPHQNYGAEKFFARRERELRGMLDNNPDVIARFDRELRHLFINQTVQQASALPPQHFFGKTIAEVGLPEPVSQAFEAHLRHVFDTGEPDAFEITFPSPTGPRDVLVRLIPEPSPENPARPTTVLSVARDVTSLKCAEQALHRSETRFRTFMDHSPAVAYLKDEAGRYVYLNERFRQRFPNAEQEWLGRTIWDVAPADLAARVQKNDQEVLAFGGTTSSVECYPSLAGEVSYWQSYKFLVEEEDGQRFVGGMSLEVTEQKRVEDERERLLAELREKNERLTALNAEKNAFLGICSHDLKNPLNGIIGLAGLLKDTAEAGGEAAEYAEDILQSAEFMFALVNNLLNVAAIEEDRFPLEPIALDLHAAAAHVAGRYGAAAEKKDIHLAGPALSAEGAPDRAASCFVLADRNATLQVLDNLISNAVKYTLVGGRVEVRVQAQPETGRVTVAVRDSGPGLRGEEQARLFQKFTRLSPRPTGGEHSTGLGLSIVKRLMGAMGGDVRCESEPGKGSTFLADFPAASATPAAMCKGTATAKAA